MSYECVVTICVWWDDKEKPTAEEVRRVVRDDIKDYLIDADVDIKKV